MIQSIISVRSCARPSTHEVQVLRQLNLLLKSNRVHRVSRNQDKGRLRRVSVRLGVDLRAIGGGNVLGDHGEKDNGGEDENEDESDEGAGHR